MYYKTFALLASFIVAASASAADLERGRSVYEGTCVACHGDGLMGAPRFGSRTDWASRVDQGESALVEHALDGYNAMPPKGGNPALTRDDVAAAVSHMLAATQQLTPAIPVSAKPSGDPLEEQKRFFRSAQLGKPFVYAMDEHGYFQPPSMDELPNDKYGAEVRLGHKIFTETQEYAARYAGRGMVCSHCHLDAGRKPNAIPLWGAAGMYPGYRFSSDKNDTMEDRMADCFRNSMNGIAPAPDSPEMRALLAYANFVSKGVPIGVHMPGRSFPDINYTGYEASPNRGRDIYASKCGSCHGADGQGKKRDNGTYQFPPLWGWNSYNKGASLYKQRKLARFIRANMPLGREFSLSEQEAWDLAAFINMHERPKSPAKGILQDLFAGGH